MKLPLALIAAVSVLAGLGCQPRVDQGAAVRALLERDRAWASAAGARNVDTILAYWTPDARVLLPGRPAYVGTAAIRQMVTGSLATPGFAITWAPDSAIVAGSGDLAYTYGTSRVTMADSTGAPVTTTAQYIEIWRKDTDGQWRCVIDFNHEGS
jgi:ketosteroid isomerase-like protein